MRLETFLLICGLAVFATPFMGVPLFWKEVAMMVCGVFIILSAIMLRYRSRRAHADTNPPYIDHAPRDE